MNGKKAKQLRWLAGKLCVAQNIPQGEGYKEYVNESNHTDWDVAKDKDGLPLTDPVTNDPLIVPVKVPGTTHLAWKYRLVYKELKQRYKQEKSLVEVK